MAYGDVNSPGLTLAEVLAEISKAMEKVASLDEAGQILVEQIPELEYLAKSLRGVANGVASLDANGDVPLAQVPPYLLYGEKSIGGSALDWNTLTPGVYFLNGSSSMGVNGPTGVGVYGTLIDFCGRYGIGRVQLYYANGASVFAMRSRYETTQSWCAWRYFNVCGTSTTIATAPNNTAYTTKQVRNTVLSTAAASGGSNGDLWFTYV